MSSRYFALIFGIVYVIVGILGFVPGVTAPPPGDAPGLVLANNYGYLFGLFPVNLLHNLVHIIIGLWGILSYGSLGAARGYSRAAAIIFAVLTIAGLVPGANIMLGFIPIFGNDIWLHAATAVIAAYFGWLAPVETPYADQA